MSGSVAIRHGAAIRSRHRSVRVGVVLATQLAVVAALGWYCLPQRLGGRADWVMVSGTSMLPRFHTGDLVLAEHQSSYHVGEVVAYRVPKGQVGAGYVVIHRIVGGNGQTGWKLQGDNRTAPDLWHPTDHDVIGSKLLRIPKAWFVLRLFHMPLMLGLFAGFAAFFVLAFSGNGEDDESVTAPAAPASPAEEYGWWD
jgi:signal peptidase I